MKVISAVFLIILLPIITIAQTGKFPSVETEKLNGDIIQVPDEFIGSYTLIGIGTSKRAEEDLRTWQVPVYNKFIAKTGLMDDMYNVDVCFLPLFTGLAKTAKNKVVKKLKEQNESVVYDHLYIYSGPREPFKAFGIDEKETPYFFLVDKEGFVAWKGEGRFRQSYFDEIEAILNK